MLGEVSGDGEKMLKLKAEQPRRDFIRAWCLLSVTWLSVDLISFNHPWLNCGTNFVLNVGIHHTGLAR